MSFFKTRVAVLRGGQSSRYEDSLRSGAYVLTQLPDSYEGVDVLIDKAGTWYLGGVSKSPEHILRQTDIVWNMLHAPDSRVDEIIRLFKIPSVGSAGSALAHPVFVKDVLKAQGVRLPEYAVFRKENFLPHQVHETFRTFPYPARVRGVGDEGTRVISYIVRTLPELHQTLADIFSVAGAALVEETISGKQAFSGVIDGYRGQTEYVLPVVDSTYRSRSFLEQEKKKISDLALRVHNILDAQHYSHIETIIHPQRGMFLVDADVSPVMHETSPFVQSLATVGASLKDVMSGLLQQNYFRSA